MIEIWIDFSTENLQLDWGSREDQSALGPFSGGEPMAAKQTRRSISVRGTTYDSLRRYCVARSRSMSEVVEELLERLLARTPPARTVANHVVRAPAGSPGRPAPTPAERIAGTRRGNSAGGDYRTIRF
jgi:hypothetical protein